MDERSKKLLLGGLVVAGVAGTLVVKKELDDLATGQPMLDRLDIRGPVLLWSSVYGVDPQVIMGIVHQESGGDPKHYLGDMSSSHGPSIGPMQVSRDTAKALGLWSPPTDGSDERDAYAALVVPGCELKLIRWGVVVFNAKSAAHPDDIAAAVAAYNGSGQAAEDYSNAVANFIGQTFNGGSSSA